MTQPTEAQSQRVDRQGNFQGNDRQAAIADVTGTADATYSTNEQDLINDLVTAVNAILANNRLRGDIAD